MLLALYIECRLLSIVSLGFIQYFHTLKSFIEKKTAPLRMKPFIVCYETLLNLKKI